MLDEALPAEDMESAPAPAPVEATGEQILFSIMSMPNIAEALAKDGTRLAELAASVCDDYDLDEKSRDEWLEKNREALKLAMLIAGPKDYPFKNSANVKFPLLTTAALQFNARAYPAIVAPDRVVKCSVRGRDPQGIKAQRADRVSEYMSDQLFNEMPEWEEDTDRLLIMLPIVGSVFRKVWYDPALRRNRSKLVAAKDFVVNYHAPSVLVAPRCTEVLRLYPYEIEERIRDGRFLEFDYKNAGTGDTREDAPDTADASAPHVFLEQYRLIDLDEDGYPEPYIVTVHKESCKVVRIVANFDAESVMLSGDRRVLSIRRRDYFVHYQFMPNPEGGLYGLGFGWLLSSTNETINSTLNQLLDAGHMANMQGGLVSETLGIKEKSIKLERGEWRVIKTGGARLSDSVMPINYGEPSSVLFQLLGLMIEMGKEVSATKDVLTGDSSKSNAPVGTTLALIEQGLQVFTSIYKRVHRALKQELGIYARLNEANLSAEAYVAFFDEQVDPKADFNTSDMDILPISDPQSVTKMQKLAKAQFVLETGRENPMVNQEEALRRVYQAADIEDIDSLIVPPPQPDPAEAAFMQAIKELGLQEQMAKITETYTKSLKNIADAEAAEEGRQISLYDMFLRTIQAENGMEQANAGPTGPGGVPGVEGAPSNAAGAGALPPAGAGGTEPPAGAVAQQPVAGAVPQPAGAGGVPQGAL